LTFVHEWLFVIATSLGFSVAGGFAIIPFRRHFPFAFLLAPMFGIILVTLGSLAFYILLNLSFQFSFLLSATGCAAATALATWAAGLRPHARSLVLPLLVLVVVSAAATKTDLATTVRFDSPSILYMDGTDHVFYTHAANWLLSNRISAFVHLDQDDPFQTWIFTTFVANPRASSYAFFAIIAFLRGLPPFFAYDCGCAMVLTCGVIAVAAAFARRSWVLVFLAIGLFTSHWFDYTRTGYLGKIMSYPADFSLTALVVSTAQQPISLLAAALLALMTFAASLTLTGTVTAFYLATLVGGYLLFSLLLSDQFKSEQGRRLFWEVGILLALLVGVAICATGVLARPMELRFPSYNLTWDYVLARMLDLDNQGVGLSGMTGVGLIIASGVALLCSIALAVIAIIRRDALASALLLVPLVQAAMLMIFDARATAFQMIGTFHPLWLCGTAVLLNNVMPIRFGSTVATTKPDASPWQARAMPVMVIGLALMAVGLRIPRFIGALDRYAGGSETPVIQQFVKAQFDAIEKAVDAASVDVDIPGPTHALAILTELRRRGLDLHWEPRAWKIVSYGRPVPPPTYPQRGTFRLRMVDEPIEPAGAEVVLETNQFRLLRPHNAGQKP
jgi:hypothetical protein